MIYKTLFLDYTRAWEISDLLNKQYEKGWEFVSFSEKLFIFKEVGE